MKKIKFDIKDMNVPDKEFSKITKVTAMGCEPIVMVSKDKKSLVLVFDDYDVLVDGVCEDGDTFTFRVPITV